MAVERAKLRARSSSAAPNDRRHHLVHEVPKRSWPERGQHVATVPHAMRISVAHMIEGRGRNAEQTGGNRPVRIGRRRQRRPALHLKADGIVGILAAEGRCGVRGVVRRRTLRNEGQPVGVVVRVRATRRAQRRRGRPHAPRAGQARGCGSKPAATFLRADRDSARHAGRHRGVKVDQPTHAGVDREPVRQDARHEG